MFKTAKGREKVMDHLAAVLQSIAGFDKAVHDSLSIYCEQCEQYQKSHGNDESQPVLLINDEVVTAYDLAKLFRCLHYINRNIDPKILNNPSLENELAIKNAFRQKLMIVEQLKISTYPLPDELQAWIA